MAHKTGKTLRKMKPQARKLAKLAHEAEKMSRALIRLADKVNSIEGENDAWQTRQKHYRNEVDGKSLDPLEQQYLSKATKNLF